MLRKNVEKKFLMDHLDAVLLAIDELVDGGYVKVNFVFIKKEIDTVCL